MGVNPSAETSGHYARPCVVTFLILDSTGKETHLNAQHRIYEESETGSD